MSYLVEPQRSQLKLSICITTFNRATLIGGTLESILRQITDDCEVLVLDGGSTDQTESVVSGYARRFAGLRYIRRDVNGGYDRDCNVAVESARGEYCWLMTDDDLVKPGAVEAVLRAIDQGVSLIIVNGDIRNFDLSKVVQPRWLDFETDRVWEADEMDRLVADTAAILRYVGCFVIKRAIWLTRNKEKYYDSLFVFFGVIFQERLPGKAYAIAEPYISYRFGNTHTWSSLIFETFLLTFPSLVWSMPTLSDDAKNALEHRQPWRDPNELLLYRAWGWYSRVEFERFIRPRLRTTREAVIPRVISLLPGALVNAFFIAYFAITRHWYRGRFSPEFLLLTLRESRFYAWRPRVVGARPAS